jgi:AcrR family transcriptional regulator
MTQVSNGGRSLSSSSEDQSRHRRKRVAKGEWLTIALEELERSGIGAVRIERLAARLHVARSGFYWHFKDHRDLLRHLLDFWLHEFTAVVTSNPTLMEGEPTERLNRIMTMVDENHLGRYDLAIHAWAKHDEMARQAVERANKVRLDFLRSLFSEMGFKGAEREMRARLFVGFQSLERAIFEDMSARTRARLRKRRLELLTKP